jgi:hypothetical protein
VLGWTNDDDDRPIAIARSELMTVLVRGGPVERQFTYEAIEDLSVRPGVRFGPVSPDGRLHAVVLDGMPIGAMWAPADAQRPTWTGFTLVTNRFFDLNVTAQGLVDDIVNDWLMQPIDVFADPAPRPPHRGEVN